MTKVQIHKISSYIPKYNTKFVLVSIIAPKAAHLRFLVAPISPVNTRVLGSNADLSVGLYGKCGIWQFLWTNFPLLFWTGPEI